MTAELENEPWLNAPTLLVTAHPDDETVGLGSRLSSFKNLTIALVTDGAPRTGTDSQKAGCPSWQEYAALRQREMMAALQIAGCDDARIERFEYPDQQAMFHIGEIAGRLSALICQLRPEFVFTHSYEGGHPDHDSASVAVYLARRKLDHPPGLYEFASYHAFFDSIEIERFIGQPLSHPLPMQQQTQKKHLFNCYSSQSAVLSMFPVEHEPIRVAPRYDYGELPNNGLLQYERWGWTLTGADWLDCARRALAK